MDGLVDCLSTGTPLLGIDKNYKLVLQGLKE